MSRAAWRSARTGALALAAAGVTGFVLLRAYPPAEYAWLPACPIHTASGLFCPGCGTARALGALATGDLRSAADLNLLAVLLLPLLAAWGILLFVRTVRDNRWQTPSLPGWMLMCLLALTSAFTVARNLPFPWGRWLAP